MNNQPKIDRVLQRVEPGRREALRKILAGTAIYAAPVVASFSIEGLGGVAQAQVSNQPPEAVPAMSKSGLAGLLAMMAAAGALLLRRFRGR
jgi:hypothetical protein